MSLPDSSSRSSGSAATRSALPIEAIRQQLVDALGRADGSGVGGSRSATEGVQRSRRVVLAAPTGSGKSTQVPQMLVDEGLIGAGKQVVVLQPRRLAARMLAQRIAKERGVKLGDEVGFHIRFDRVFGASTRIKFITEAVLLRMLQSDPQLSEVGALVFDEFHERNLYSDLGLALTLQVQKSARPDLAIVVMSATLETQSVCTYLEPCTLLEAHGRTYPLQIRYSAAAARVAGAPVWDQAAYHFNRLAEEKAEGDVLIFMPGAYEIRRTVEAVQATPHGRDCVVLPLHGQLPPQEQDAALERFSKRKVVVATNVAETSLTIDGIGIVIDSGLVRQAAYDPRRGINTLLIENTSRASADQRAGRAGRTAEGLVLRLWGEREHEHRAPRTQPEVLRVDLTETVLTLVELGVSDLETFPWFERPVTPALLHAISLLRDLGAITTGSDGVGILTDTAAATPKATAAKAEAEAEGAGSLRAELPTALTLTPLGRSMARFPLHPRYARLLLAAGQSGCLWQAALVAAFSQGRSILLPLQDKRRNAEREELLGEAQSDFLPLLRLWGMARKQNYDLNFCRQWGIHAQAAREVEQVAAQFLRIAREQGLDAGGAGGDGAGADEAALRRCILLAFSDQVARRDRAGTLLCSLVGGRRGELRRESFVHDAPLLVAAAIDEIETRAESTVYLSLVSAIEVGWLRELFPQDFSQEAEVHWDNRLKKVTARTCTRFRDLVLEAQEAGEPPLDKAAALLAQAALAGTLELKKWNHEVEQWISRVNFVARRCPELEIAPIDADARLLILEQFCYGETASKGLREKSPWPYLRDWLTAEQLSALESFAPTHFTLPRRNRSTELRYEPQHDRVVLSSRLQDFYDVSPKSLTIGGGKIPLVVEMLAPNGRPCHITESLEGFWAGSAYEGIKKELKGRYPKHEWR